MAKRILVLGMLFLGFFAHSQITSLDFRSKKIMVTQDTIRFDSVSINPQRFKVLNNQQRAIFPSEYQIIYNEAILIINSQKYQEITI